MFSINYRFLIIVCILFFPIMLVNADTMDFDCDDLYGCSKDNVIILFTYEFLFIYLKSISQLL